MEKLIELLNEWYEERYNVNPCFDRFEDYGGNDYGYFCSSNSKTRNIMNETEVWTKKYGFIQWLVENDKIDFYNVLKENGTFRKEFYAIENKKEYERLIMLLSVEDNPIEFLISILKIS